MDGDFRAGKVEGQDGVGEGLMALGPFESYDYLSGTGESILYRTQNQRAG